MNNPPISVAGTTWVWRPDLWARSGSCRGPDRRISGALLSRDAKVFHDCGEHCVTVQETVADDQSVGVIVRAQGDEGSFVSLVLDFPAAGVSNLSARYIVGVRHDLENLGHRKAYVRLNVKYGPNTEAFVLPVDPINSTVEFDLGFSEIGNTPIHAAWAELIFENPDGCNINVRDLTLYTRPRAEL